MSHVIHRHLAAQPPIAVRGEGLRLWDAAGKCYLDASGGAAVSCLGHGHPEIRAAIHAQVDAIAYAHTGFFSSAPAEALAEHLAQHAPAGLDQVYFVSGGSEAMEAALKLARQVAVERGEAQRTLLVARRQSYHGNTLGALAVGGNAWRRRPFSPLLIDVAHVSPCYEYRDRFADETQDGYTQRLLAELDAQFRALGPDRVIAFCAETIGGATAGALPPTPGYFRGVRALCDRYGILWIADEVMCGMGRTGRLYAVEEEGAVPDLITIAKGLGGGYQPIGAVLVQRRIIAAIAAGSGHFQHGHTYGGHPTAAAAALAVQRVIQRDRLLDQVVRRGLGLAARLRARFAAHRHIGDIRGRGLFLALELVADRSSREPFHPDDRLHARIKARAFENGLIVYPMGGTIDGRRGDHVLLAPPFLVTESELDEIVDLLARSIDEAIAAVRGDPGSR
jgi:adenosylmethionine-8-amino-7-oxononanoate aminotransferase